MRMNARTERGRLVPVNCGLLINRRGRAVPVPFCEVSPQTRVGAFTLIELLVVIGVIAILASMVVGLGPLANRNKLDRRVKAEMAQLQLGIEAYKAKKGFYPPTNTNDVSRSPLYYELAGTQRDGANYKTLNDGSTITADPIQLANFYGVGGFINSVATAKGDPDAPAVQNFLQKLKPDQVQDTGGGAKYLGVPFRGPDDPNLNFTRWRYNAHNATNNPEGYDLWIDLIQGGKVRTWGNFKTQE